VWGSLCQYIYGIFMIHCKDLGLGCRVDAFNILLRFSSALWMDSKRSHFVSLRKMHHSFFIINKNLLTTRRTPWTILIRRGRCYQILGIKSCRKNLTRLAKLVQRTFQLGNIWCCGGNGRAEQGGPGGAFTIEGCAIASKRCGLVVPNSRCSSCIICFHPAARSVGRVVATYAAIISIIVVTSLHLRLITKSNAYVGTSNYRLRMDYESEK
jgi:hypothetical protein